MPARPTASDRHHSATKDERDDDAENLERRSRQRAVFDRRWDYVLQALVGTGILVLSALPIDGDHADPVESAVFHLINGLPSFLYPLVWLPMQMGNLIALPALALIAGLVKKWRVALGLLAAIPAKLYLARLVKDVAVRHRPGSFIQDVVLRGDASATGQAFVSGHAIVAFAIATLLHPHLGPRLRILVWAAAALVCLGRIYVGAHLPLDVIGGAGLGWAIGAAINFLLVTRRQTEAGESR